MFGIGLIGLALIVVVPLLTIVGCIALSTRHRDGEIPAAKEWGWVRLIRLLGIALGILLAVVLANLRMADHGVGMMAAPAGFGLGVLLGVVAGETIVRAPRSPGPRTASLQPRSAGRYLPRPSTYAVGTGLALLVATLVLGTLTAQEDESLGGMRSIGCHAGSVSQTHSPYPGSFYTVPLGIVLGVVLVTAAIAAVTVARRPRGLAPTDAGDDALRRRSMTVIVAAVGVAVGTSLTGIAGAAAAGLLGLGADCAPAWMPVAGTLLVPVALIGLGLAAWSLARLFVNDSLTSTDAAAVRSTERV